jgi:truncated hemoglobin YjbI
MKFDLLAFLTNVLGGFDVPGIEEKAVAWLKEKGAEYPDLRERADAFASYLSATLAEVDLDPSTMKDTLWGIASDVVHGTAGVDPKAWTLAG